MNGPTPHTIIFSVHIICQCVVTAAAIILIDEHVMHMRSAKLTVWKYIVGQELIEFHCDVAILAKPIKQIYVWVSKDHFYLCQHNL